MRGDDASRIDYEWPQHSIDREIKPVERGTTPAKGVFEKFEPAPAMKLHHRLIFAAFTVAVITVAAQTVDTSTGTLLDSNSASSSAPRSPAPVTKLRAAMVPMNADSETIGNVHFSLIGDAVNVTGQLQGLQPNQRYHLQIDMPAPAPAERAAAVNDGPSAAGTPVAATSAAGTPNAGKPDGNQRPGSLATGSPQTEPAANGAPSLTRSPAADLGTASADSTGALTISAVLRNVDFTAGPAGILGRTVGIMPVSESGPTDTSAPIATGVIGQADASEKTPAP